MFIELRQNEITVHWARNSYFLLTSSILLVGLVQVKEVWFQLAIGASGFSLNLVWLLIQERSNLYIDYWNGVVDGLGGKLGLPKFYPPGFKIPIRILALLLPLPFLVLWLVVVVATSYGILI